MDLTLLDLIGWTSTVLFVGSFLLKSRWKLHAVGFCGAIFKLTYVSMYHQVPMMVNWSLLLVIEGFLAVKYYKEQRLATASVEEHCRCNH